MHATWAVITVMLAVILIGVAIGNLVLRIRRISQREQRGFEVITKPVSEELPEARKE